MVKFRLLALSSSIISEETFSNLFKIGVETILTEVSLRYSLIENANSNSDPEAKIVISEPSDAIYAPFTNSSYLFSKSKNSRFCLVRTMAFGLPDLLNAYLYAYSTSTLLDGLIHPNLVLILRPSDAL